MPAAVTRSRPNTSRILSGRCVVSGLPLQPPNPCRPAGSAVADHATPVGSGTVARTKRIPVERRAEAAVIAWMRHQTTAYDSMPIPRVKGKRREVRRLLAQRSKELLDAIGMKQ